MMEKRNMGSVCRFIRSANAITIKDCSHNGNYSYPVFELTGHSGKVKFRVYVGHRRGLTMAESNELMRLTNIAHGCIPGLCQEEFDRLKYLLKKKQKELNEEAKA